MEGSPAQALLPFFMAYGALLATPGPNMLAVGGIAAASGFARAVPICLGLAAGAVSLAGAAALAATGVTAGVERGDDAAWRVGGASLLVLVAFTQARAGAAEPRDGAARRGLAFGAGFCTAATNPLTIAFFVAQLAAGPLGGAAAGWGVLAALLGVGAVALGFYLGMAALMANPRARRAALRWERPIRFASAGALLLSAGAMLRPVLPG